MNFKQKYIDSLLKAGNQELSFKYEYKVHGGPSNSKKYPSIIYVCHWVNESMVSCRYKIIFVIC